MSGKREEGSSRRESCSRSMFGCIWDVVPVLVLVVVAFALGMVVGLHM